MRTFFYFIVTDYVDITVIVTIAVEIVIVTIIDNVFIIITINNIILSFRTRKYLIVRAYDLTK